MLLLYSRKIFCQSKFPGAVEVRGVKPLDLGWQAEISNRATPTARLLYSQEVKILLNDSNHP